MNSEVIIMPILFLVTGAVIIAYFYLRNKERQLIIERGLSTEQMLALYRRKKDPLIMLKTGIVILFFGIGLGGGMLLNELTGYEEFIAFMIFTFTGLGFIIAFFVSKKYQVPDNDDQ